MDTVILHGDDEIRTAQFIHHRFTHGHYPVRINDTHAEPIGPEGARCSERLSGQAAEGHQRHLGGRAGGLEGGVGFKEDIKICLRTHGIHVGWHAALGETDYGGGIADGQATIQGLGQARAIARGGHEDARDNGGQGEVPHAVVRGAIGSRHASAVQHHGHAELEQGHVHEQLIESAVQEGGVDGHHGVESAQG